MSDLPRHLKMLDKLLLELPGEPMLTSELDGFLTGIVVCPELIMPSEWLPLVWGSGDDEAVFENSRQAEKAVGLVMEHYNSIARDLTHRSGHYSPILEVDTRHNETLWELWIDGFDRAMQLRPSAWTKLLLADEDTRTSYAGLVMLAEINSGDSKLPTSQVDQLTEKAPDLIPAWVERINNWRLMQHPAGRAPSPKVPTTKVGRNDPCPCGSGKKYKKCCGLN